MPSPMSSPLSPLPRISPRIESLRARALGSRHAGDPRAAILRAESLAQTEGEPEILREAKAIAHYYRHQDLLIGDGELLVGARPGLRSDPDAPVVPSVFGRCSWSPYPGPISEEIDTFFHEGMLAPAGNHTTLDYDAVFAGGFRGLIRRIDDRLARLLAHDPDAEEKRDFLSALRIVAEGYIELSDRYAGYAGMLAETAPDDRRRRELETIGRNCRRVPVDPPATFWEACQCAWFAFFFLPDAPGRVDQYLYPCYAADLERGAITRGFAKELLACLWIKVFESVGAGSGVSAHNHLTLGGTTPDGGEATNELTYLCLEVTEELEFPRPQVGVRWHRNAPRELLRRGARTLRAGTGSPDFCSDERIVPALERIGVRPEDARDFSLSGCHEVIVTGKAQMGSVEGFVNMPMILRMMLGLEPALEPDADPASIDSMEELWERLAASMDRVAEAAHRASIHRDRAAAQSGGDLQASLVTRDCIERAAGYFRGGARYNFCNWDVIGVANLADSLAAIRRFVFEERALRLAEWTAILAGNWEGSEPLRRRVAAMPGRFGNDDPAVDAVAARVIEAFDTILKRRVPYRGGEYILGTTAGGENMHVEFGRVTGATPDGRKAGDPLADSLGAAQGRDRRGVTALLNSVARLPHERLPTATTVNVKLDPKFLDGDEGVENIAALIDAHFRTGGQQLQFNLVDRETLIDAKRNPERHQNLMVRVSGYSAPFTSLWSDLQDEIIARTEHHTGG